MGQDGAPLSGRDTVIRAGRPFRALAGLAVVLAAWIGVRVPAMQREVEALARLLQPASA
ncbi:MAG: hypothetical protein RIS17_1014, partial [Pseudomonadota bacterium]